jgi:hypothetical protein
MPEPGPGPILLKNQTAERLSRVKIVRYLAPFLFPSWIIGYPAYCYWNEFGRIVPTREDIHTPDALWGDGLSLIPVVFGASLFLAVLAHVLLLIFFLWRGSKSERWTWFIGSVLGLASTGLTLYLFGNLMNI